MREQTIFKPLLVTISGLMIWAAHFTIIYGVNALACERNWADQQVLGVPFAPFTIIAATLVAALALLAVAVLAILGRTPELSERSNERTSVFLRKLTVWVAAISFLAVLYGTIPAFLVPPCA